METSKCGGITLLLGTSQNMMKLSEHTSGRNKGQKLVGHFLKIGHFVGF